VVSFGRRRQTGSELAVRVSLWRRIDSGCTTTLLKACRRKGR
jgi:hypothetical protein